MANASKKLREGGQLKSPNQAQNRIPKREKFASSREGRGRASAVSEKQRNTVRGKRSVRSRKVRRTV